MSRVLLALPALLLLPALSACGTEALKRGAYEGVYQKDCVDRTGSTSCDPDHPSYDEYKREREKALKEEN